MKDKLRMQIIRKILFLLFRTGPGWVFFLIMLRIVLFFIWGQGKNEQEQIADKLIQQIAVAQTTELQDISINTTVELAKHSEDIRNYIQKQSQSKLSQYPIYQELQQRLQADPLLTLQQLHNALRPSKRAIAKPIFNVLCILCGIAFILPILWAMVWGKLRKMKLLYSGGWYCLIPCLLVWGASITLLHYGFVIVEIVHIIMIFVILMLLVAVLRSQAGQIIFTLSKKQILKVMIALALILSLTMIPYFLPEHQTLPSETQQLVAIQNIINQHRVDLIPMLSNLLPFHQQLKSNVYLKMVSTIGELGQESQIDILLQTLPHCTDPDKQLAIWNALHQILTRCH